MAGHAALALRAARVSQPAKRCRIRPGGKWIAAACRTGGVEIWPLTPDGPPHRLLVTGSR